MRKGPLRFSPISNLRLKKPAHFLHHGEQGGGGAARWGFSVWMWRCVLQFNMHCHISVHFLCSLDCLQSQFKLVTQPSWIGKCSLWILQAHLQDSIAVTVFLVILVEIVKYWESETSKLVYHSHPVPTYKTSLPTGSFPFLKSRQVLINKQDLKFRGSHQIALLETLNINTGKPSRAD